MLAYMHAMASFRLFSGQTGVRMSALDLSVWKTHTSKKIINTPNQSALI